jgi:hypothetical protein
MCTVIAKETASRVTVLTGIPCCLQVENVTPAIPNVTRENGWFELFEGEIRTDVPHWASWLADEAKLKVLKDRPVKCRGKWVRFVDAGDRLQSLTKPKRHVRRKR